MSKEINRLKNQIMVRIYYAFGIKVATSPATVNLVVIVGALYLLGRLVHVAAVYHNLLNVRVGDLGDYILGTLLRADVATLLVLGALVFASLSLPWRLPRLFHLSLA